MQSPRFFIFSVFQDPPRRAKLKREANARANEHTPPSSDGIRLMASLRRVGMRVERPKLSYQRSPHRLYEKTSDPTVQTDLEKLQDEWQVFHT
jgi:hypothetical protein